MPARMLQTQQLPHAQRRSKGTPPRRRGAATPQRRRAAPCRSEGWARRGSGASAPRPGSPGSPGPCAAAPGGPAWAETSPEAAPAWTRSQRTSRRQCTGTSTSRKAILLMLIGGVPREQQADYSYRSTLHICLIGETATAKSVLLRWAAAFSPRGVYVSGSSSSAAGLTAALVPDESELDGRSIRPGALIMAGGGVCCIDDFEQLPERDQGSIREAMDQQVVSLSKAGVHTRLNAAASVLLACSHGGLGESALRVEDVMPLNVAACFDLTFTLRDDVDAAADGEVARWMVASACGRHAPCLSEEPKGPQEERLRRHVRLARGLRPELTDAASARLQDSYVRLRQAARGSESAAAGAAAPSPRLLTALIRLSEAVARARLASEVQEVDVDEALSLLQSSVGSASQSLRARPSRSVPAPRGKRACVGSLG
ncbi:unnamed protein product [Prorocentrum cordatum]|uniref:MCM C-terminal AAA(+) ATPase domain-containing protein n=1 Tax=Prorocentrum cordatum TaxID=2364126 RepID=A0ABN9R4M1_9DINO|nr:unnamed protein product [Polarella glacialis]